MNKPEIKKLNYPVWFTIVFYILTVVTPITILLVQGFTSESATFKVSFSVISIAMIAWVFIKKFVLKGIEDKILNKKAALEHDYEIEVGSADKAKYLWYSNELILILINVVQTILVGGLFLLLAVGIENLTINVKASSFAMIILYIVAYTAKIIFVLVKRDKEFKEEQSTEEDVVK